MRTNQRGFLFLGLTVIEMVLYGAVALAAIGALYGIWHSINSTLEHHYADPVRKELEPKIAALTTDNNTCTAANASLDGQFTTFRRLHNDAIDFQNKEYEKLRARKAQAQVEAAPKLADIQMEKFNAIVAAKAAGLSCDQLDSALLQEAKRKQRYYGPATDPAPQGGVRLIEPARKP